MCHTSMHTGERSGVWSQGSCTHTWDDLDLSGTGTTDPFWGVDLEEEAAVGAVRLWNRVDCCAERLQGVDIYIGNHTTPFRDASVCASNVHVRGGDSEIVWCGQVGEGGVGGGGVAVGRYVFVVLPGEAKILTICEAEVYATQESGEFVERESLGQGPGKEKEKRDDLPHVKFLEPDEEVVTGMCFVF